MRWRPPRPTPKPTPTVVIGRDLPHGTDLSAAVPAGPRRSRGRGLVESLLLIVAGLLVLRVFVAEAYIVPTGSMAPSLVGSHADLRCSDCGIGFELGLNDAGEPEGRPVCPNCGQSRLSPAPARLASGDRLLVHKHTFAWRPPRRWEPAVFVGSGGLAESFVKRVVGLPGESVEIRDGDLWIDGALARKSLEEIRALRIPVYDDDYRPTQSAIYPRWIPRQDTASDPSSSGWTATADGFQHTATRRDGRPDWLEYQHWDPETLRPGPVRDFLGYNGAGVGGDHVVRDLMIEFEVSLGQDCDRLHLEFETGGERLEVRLPVAARSTLEVLVNDRPLEIQAAGEPQLTESPADPPRWTAIEASIVDRRLLVAIDGQMAFTPVDLETPPDQPARGTRLALGVSGGSAAIRHLRVYRDIYYTERLAGSMRPGHGVDSPCQLGRGEYYVLGDNSAVSNDSRFWSDGPVVSEAALVGRPFLVHVPGRSIPIAWGEQPLFWIPDPRAIRYIR
ncbi:MAG: hypothetical protein KatS3mg108_1908 [Isosphaeraceae bacterium]|nr:MAG: hypothetical protein KatS3mg108_1908 [Isosphaeraceae bacterium]